MSTFAEMKANLTNLIRHASVAAQAGNAINRAISYYSREPWPHTEVRSTSLVTVADTRTVALPSGFTGDLKLMATVGSFLVDVDKMPIQWIEEQYVSNDYSGQPSHYAIFDDSIYLYPIPDAVYSLTFSYYSDLAVLSADGDTNFWTTDAEDLIEQRAIWWLSTTLLQDPARASAAKAAELEIYGKLRRKATLIQASGTLRQHEI